MFIGEMAKKTIKKHRVFPANHISKISDITYSDKLLLDILLDNPQKSPHMRNFNQKYLIYSQRYNRMFLYILRKGDYTKKEL